MRTRLRLLARALAVAVLVVLAVALLGGSVSAVQRPGSSYGWPLAGQPHVDRPFTPPRTAYGAGHRGVDLRGWDGAVVRSAGPGWVSYAGLLAGRGVVTVRHAGGLRTTYEPVSPSVRVGQPVSRGTAIGTLRGRHRSCRPGTVCLHWGLLRGQAYLDPLSLIEPPELRLLPLGPDLAGAVRLRASQGTALPGRVTPARPATRSRSGLALGAGVALGAVVLGGSALRRQDARGRGP